MATRTWPAAVQEHQQDAGLLAQQLRQGNGVGLYLPVVSLLMSYFLTAESAENAKVSKGGRSNRWKWRSIAYLQELQRETLRSLRVLR